MADIYTDTIGDINVQVDRNEGTISLHANAPFSTKLTTIDTVNLIQKLYAYIEFIENGKIEQAIIYGKGTKGISPTALNKIVENVIEAKRIQLNEPTKYLMDFHHDQHDKELNSGEVGGNITL
jgi:hypothetical protein